MNDKISCLFFLFIRSEQEERSENGDASWNLALLWTMRDASVRSPGVVHWQTVLSLFSHSFPSFIYFLFSPQSQKKRMRVNHSLKLKMMFRPWSQHWKTPPLQKQLSIIKRRRRRVRRKQMPAKEQNKLLLWDFSRRNDKILEFLIPHGGRHAKDTRHTMKVWTGTFTVGLNSY